MFMIRMILCSVNVALKMMNSLEFFKVQYCISKTKGWIFFYGDGYFPMLSNR